jgi:hypothetical protein
VNGRKGITRFSVGVSGSRWNASFYAMTFDVCEIDPFSFVGKGLVVKTVSGADYKRR